MTDDLKLSDMIERIRAVKKMSDRYNNRRSLPTEDLSPHEKYIHGDLLRTDESIIVLLLKGVLEAAGIDDVFSIVLHHNLETDEESP